MHQDRRKLASTSIERLVSCDTEYCCVGVFNLSLSSCKLYTWYWLLVTGWPLCRPHQRHRNLSAFWSSITRILITPWPFQWG